MTFRRFLCYQLDPVSDKRVEVEMLINTDFISRIYKDAKGQTWIETCSARGISHSFTSPIDYEHLAVALDGES